ncbi:MAG: hypothetical protein RMK99_14415 [Anaerolineales bacterium]|nr:hypothetical protein [Anaerolineales bacterium]
MIERKQRLFPHIKRFVIDFTVTDEGKHFRLAVVSTLTPEDIVSRLSAAECEGRRRLAARSPD